LKANKLEFGRKVSLFKRNEAKTNAFSIATRSGKRS